MRQRRYPRGREWLILNCPRSIVVAIAHELSLLKLHATTEATSRRKVLKLCKVGKLRQDCTTLGDHRFPSPNAATASWKSGPSGPRRNVGRGGLSPRGRSSCRLVSSILFSRHHTAQRLHQTPRCLL